MVFINIVSRWHQCPDTRIADEANIWYSGDNDELLGMWTNPSGPLVPIYFFEDDGSILMTGDLDAFPNLEQLVCLLSQTPLLSLSHLRFSTYSFTAFHRKYDQLWGPTSDLGPVVIVTPSHLVMLCACSSGSHRYHFCSIISCIE